MFFFRVNTVWQKEMTCQGPGHDVRFPYKPEEIIKLRQGITEGILKK